MRQPPTRFFNQGTLNKEVLEIILHNVRIPEGRRGDLIAQVTSLNLGADRLTKLLDRYGEETVFAAIAELKARSKQLMRSHIETIPDGKYVFEDYIDSDGVEWKPLTIHMEMEVKGSELFQKQPTLQGTA